MSFGEKMFGRNTPRAHQAADAYVDPAHEYSLDPIHMALAWCAARPFRGAVIFGATNADQLQHIIDGLNAIVPPELAQEINTQHQQTPMPY